VQLLSRSLLLDLLLLPFSWQAEHPRLAAVVNCQLFRRQAAVFCGGNFSLPRWQLLAGLRL
jgi:hypothetical protein